MEITLVDLPPVLQIQLQVCAVRLDIHLGSRFEFVLSLIESAMGPRDGPIVEITGVREVW